MPAIIHHRHKNGMPDRPAMQHISTATLPHRVLIQDSFPTHYSITKLVNHQMASKGLQLRPHSINFVPLSIHVHQPPTKRPGRHPLPIQWTSNILWRRPVGQERPQPHGHFIYTCLFTIKTKHFTIKITAVIPPYHHSLHKP